MSADLLARIVSATAAAVASRRAVRPDAALERAAQAAAPRGTAFRDAIACAGRVNVIAECKRRSPIKGLLREDYDPAALARAYEAAGAAAISVLTEPSFFDGALEHLAEARAAVAVPVLRKDFVLDTYQLLEAQAAGADAVLLIVAVLGDRLPPLLGEAESRGLAALVEVHDEEELARAVDAGARLIGVNSRNLRTMTIKPETCVELAARMPPAIVAVAESGLRRAEDIARLRAAGYSAFLVGEHLVRSAEPGAALRQLIEGVGTQLADDVFE